MATWCQKFYDCQFIETVLLSVARPCGGDDGGRGGRQRSAHLQRGVAVRVDLPRTSAGLSEVSRFLDVKLEGRAHLVAYEHCCDGEQQQ